MSFDGSAVPPFHFDCHRCGNCCRVGHGQVWLDAADVVALAALLEVELAHFSALYVRRVGGRLSLREQEDGRCILLDDANVCRAYAARPAQCRSFPFWPQLLASTSALEHAAGYCLGIQRFPAAELGPWVLLRAAEILEPLLGTTKEDSSATEGERWGSSLEVDLYLATAVERRLSHSEAIYTARMDLEQLAQESGYPWSVGPWQRLLDDRRNGWVARGAWPTIKA